MKRQIVKFRIKTLPIFVIGYTKLLSIKMLRRTNVINYMKFYLYFKLFERKRRTKDTGYKCISRLFNLLVLLGIEYIDFHFESSYHISFFESYFFFREQLEMITDC